MPGLETRVVVTDSYDNEHTCTNLDLQALLHICTSMVQFNEHAFKSYNMWVEGGHSLGVEIDNGNFYISFADAETYVKLIEEHLGTQGELAV